VIPPALLLSKREAITSSAL